MGPRFERLPRPPLLDPPKKSVCPLMDRQMNNPVVRNIIIDALTFTCSALPTCGGRRCATAEEGEEEEETSRHLICRQIPETPSKTIVFERQNAEVGLGDERPRRLNDGAMEQ